MQFDTSKTSVSFTTTICYNSINIQSHCCEIFMHMKKSDSMKIILIFVDKILALYNFRRVSVCERVSAVTFFGKERYI